MVFGLFVGGCNNDSGALKGVIGAYTVSIASGGKMDPDIMSISNGAGGTLLFTFVAGITTDAMGINPDGLRGTLDGMNIKVESQPVHIDHSTGQLDGFASADGTIVPDGSTVTLNLHFQPTNFALRDADGGVLPTPDGGLALIEYVITGAKQQ